MKVYSIVFSPTGTSSRIAGAIVSAFCDETGVECHTIDVTKRFQSPDFRLERDDIVFFAAPVYGGKMAPAAKERMSAITGAGTRCVLVAVYGNRAFENALNDMSDFVIRSGFVPVAAGAFIGEHSYSTDRTPIACFRPDTEDMASAAEFGAAIAGSPWRACQSGIDVSVLRDELSPDASLTAFRDFVKEYQIRQQESPRQFLPEKEASLCAGCGLCRDECPMEAISEDCAVVDGSRCIKCCACVKCCPEKAWSLNSPFAPVLSANFNQRKSPVWTAG